MYKQCRKDSKYKGELIKEKGESALYTPQTHTSPLTPPTAVTLFGILKTLQIEIKISNYNVNCKINFKFESKIAACTPAIISVVGGWCLI